MPAAARSAIETAGGLRMATSGVRLSCQQSARVNPRKSGRFLASAYARATRSLRKRHDRPRNYTAWRDVRRFLRAAGAGAAPGGRVIRAPPHAVENRAVAVVLA